MIESDGTPKVKTKCKGCNLTSSKMKWHANERSNQVDQKYGSTHFTINLAFHQGSVPE